MSKKKEDTDGLLPSRFDPVLTEEEMRRGEEKEKEWSVSRRLILASLARSSEQLTIDSVETGETMLDFLQTIRVYIEHREAEIELCKSAEARTLVVLTAYSESIGV